MRAALLVGCIRFSFSAFKFSVFLRASDGSAITAQPDCCSEECRGHNDPDPETWRAQISSWGELGQRVDRGVALSVETKSVRRESHQTVRQHGGEVRSVEGYLLEDLNRD